MAAFGTKHLRCPCCAGKMCFDNKLSNSQGLVGEYVWSCEASHDCGPMLTAQCDGRICLRGDVVMGDEKSSGARFYKYAFNKNFEVSCFVTGIMFRSVFELLQLCRMNPPAKSTFNYTVKDELSPVLSDLHEKEEARVHKLIEGLPNWPGQIGTDARFDSTRGAFNGTVTWMDMRVV